VTWASWQECPAEWIEASCETRSFAGIQPSAGTTRSPSDNHILECASAGGAALIVTGDRAMLALGRFEGVEIIMLREFLGRMAPVA
jgi:predicted nucleic acid-binding protein